jgi:hypothetical protein
MAAISKPIRPKKGDDVRLLWRHVDNLIDLVNKQAAEITLLKSKASPRRKLDPGLVYVKCCLADSTVAYIGVLACADIYRHKGTGTYAATITESGFIPDGATLLE